METMTNPYDYLSPTDEQKSVMEQLRTAAKVYHDALMTHLPDGPDKTFCIRHHRTTAMWANVAIARQPDGSRRG